MILESDISITLLVLVSWKCISSLKQQTRNAQLSWGKRQNKALRYKWEAKWGGGRVKMGQLRLLTSVARQSNGYG